MMSSTSDDSRHWTLAVPLALELIQGPAAPLDRLGPVGHSLGYKFEVQPKVACVCASPFRGS
jgi:hypothetical protein